MAVDAVKLYIDGLKSKMCECEIRDIRDICPITNRKCDSTLENEVFNTDLKDNMCSNNSIFKGFVFVENKQNRYLSYYWKQHEGIYIKYSPYLNQGELRIRFNIPKLITGTNLTSIYQYNIQQLFESLNYKLKDYLNLSRVSQLRYWRVSFVEINMDIILEKKMIDAIFTVLEKTSTTTKYKQDRLYCDNDGAKTLYFISKKAKKLNGNNDIVIKFYYKIPEMKAHKDSLNMEYTYNNDDIVNLNVTQNILRMEVSLNRDIMYSLYKPIGIDLSTYKHPIGTFEQVIDYDHQCKMLSDILTEFGLNKMITTKKTLWRIIKDNDELSNEKKSTYWNVVQHKNRVSHLKKPKDLDIKNCITFMESKGYNILYADVDVEAIKLEDIIKSLPIAQQREIETYKHSNIYKDLLFYKSTPPIKRIS